MRFILGRIVIAISFGVVVGQTQPALVTFYSAGCQFCPKNFLFDVLAGSAVVPYGGPIYDGSAKLIKTMTPNRFVTVRMQPGEHTFAGDHMGVFSLKQTRAKKQGLQLTLQPGRHYFVSLLTRDTGVTFTFRRFTPILSSRDCPDSFREAALTQPLQPQRIGGARIADAEPSVYFPACDTAVDSGR